MTFPVPFAFWQQSVSAFPTSGLVSYWKSDTNGSFPDAHGSNTGTISGATYTASGKINGAYSYDGGNDSVACGSSSDFAFESTDAFSISFWVYSTNYAQNYKRILSRSGITFNSNYAIAMYATTKKIMFTNYDNSWVNTISTTALVNSTWNHVVVIYNNRNVKFFVNDTNYGDIDRGAGDDLYTASMSLEFGREKNANNPRDYFNGTIDEIGIWNRALTQAEITALYNGGSGLPYS